MTAHNIRSGLSKAGLFPFNPSRVLDGVSPPVREDSMQPPPLGPQQVEEPLNYQTLVTPTTTEGVLNLYRMLEDRLNADGATSDPCLEKFLHATEKAFADRSLLHDENESLIKQNDGKRVRQNAKSRIIGQGDAKIMFYADIIEAQRKRMVDAGTGNAKQPVKRRQKAGSEVLVPRFWFRIPKSSIRKVS